MTLHSKVEGVDQSQAGEHAPEREAEKPAATSDKGSPCLDDERALTDYSDALDKLWEP